MHENRRLPLIFLMDALRFFKPCINAARVQKTDRISVANQVFDNVVLHHLPLCLSAKYMLIIVIYGYLSVYLQMNSNM